MLSRRALIAFGMVLAATLAGSPAQAAKGTKKQSNVEHTIRGTIVNVQTNANGTGTITVKTHGAKKKTSTAKKPTAKAKKPTSTANKSSAHKHEHKIAVDAKTAVVFAANGKSTPTTLKSVHRGEHVTVLAKNHRADLVEIHKSATPKKKK